MGIYKRHIALVITIGIVLIIGTIFWIVLDHNGTSGITWGDNSGGRESYTTKQITSGILGKIITFNSIRDGKTDERNFVDAQVFDDTSVEADTAWEKNEIIVEDGKEYLLRLYVHNNNPNGEQATAKNVRAAFNIPMETAASLTVLGFLFCDNASSSEYWDSVIFVSDTPFHLEYVYGSATLLNSGIGQGDGYALSDEVVTKAASNNGVLIGYSELNGDIPGGLQYASYITIRVKVVYDTAYTLENQVRLVGGDKTWGNSVDAKIGDKVEFRIAYKNNSNSDQMNVGIRDVLPDGLKYIEGSTLLVNAKYPDGGHVEQDDIVDIGINIGGYTPGSNAFVRFQAEVVDENLAEHGKTALVNWAQGGVGQAVIQDCAKVIVYKE